MKTRKHVAVLACLLGVACFGSVHGAARAAPGGQSCKTQQAANAGSASIANGDAHVPRVKVPRQRCLPAPVRRDSGCAEKSQAHSSNPPPPAGTEPSFGEVPLAAVMPPSAPYSGEAPPGPAPSAPKHKRGCPPHPAS